MVNHRRHYLINIFISIIFGSIAIGLSSAFFKAEESSYISTSIRTILVCLPFGLPALGAMAWYSRIYNHLSAAAADGNDTKIGENIETIGKLPLISMAVFSIALILFGFGIVSFSRFIQILPGLEITLAILSVSWGMLAAASVYMGTDQINGNFLENCKITHYPSALRASRQSQKMIIIPVMTAILGLTFTFGLAGSLLLKYGSLTAIPSGSLLLLIVFVLVYYITIVSLAITGSSNHKRVFNSVIKQLDQLSSGDKDLSKRIFIGSIDEVASISGLINTFVETLADSIILIKSTQNELITVGDNLSINAHESQINVEEISGFIEKMQDQTTIQTNSIQETSSAVEEIGMIISNMNKLITEQTSSINDSSTSIEQMTSNITSINSSINTMADEFKALTETSRTGLSIQEETYIRTSEISKRSEDLQVANKVISDIAAQTNLLAMNAAIEAAHAGKSGLGFSVVAQEIRKLAEHSAANSKTIGTILNEVQSGIQQVVASSLSSKDIFSQVADKISATDQLVHEINSTMTEQQQGTSQILKALETMNDITAQVQTGATEMNLGSQTIVREIHTLNEHTSETNANMDAIVQGIEKVNESVRTVSEISLQTGDAIKQIAEAIGDFMV